LLAAEGKSVLLQGQDVSPEGYIGYRKINHIYCHEQQKGNPEISCRGGMSSCVEVKFPPYIDRTGSADGCREEDGAQIEFRYCSKCTGSYEYCQDHLFTHEHVK